MKYDFTTLLNRKGHDALALDVLPIKDVEVDPNFSTIPMWVADMNYPVFENIQKQMIERIGSLTLAHSQNSQMSFMYGFFFVKFLFFTVVCVVIVV